MYWHSKPKTNKIPTSVYMGRGKFVLVCHHGFLPVHCYPVLPSALNVHGTVLVGADVRSTWVLRRNQVIYPRWLGANLLVTFLPKLQHISWLCWEASTCKRDDKTGGWSTWGKKWNLLKVPWSHFNNLRKTYSCSRVPLKKAEAPPLQNLNCGREPARGCRRGAGISALRNSLQSVKMKSLPLQEVSRVFRFLV